MDDFPVNKSKFRLLIETALIAIIALGVWISFLYFIYLTE
jgi:hypothetical protein